MLNQAKEQATEGQKKRLTHSMVRSIRHEEAYNVYYTPSFEIPPETSKKLRLFNLVDDEQNVGELRSIRNTFNLVSSAYLAFYYSAGLPDDWSSRLAQLMEFQTFIDGAIACAIREEPLIDIVNHCYDFPQSDAIMFQIDFVREGLCHYTEAGFGQNLNFNNQCNFTIILDDCNTLLEFLFAALDACQDAEAAHAVEVKAKERTFQASPKQLVY